MTTVVVVGAGGAGLAAALESASAGASVILIEKNDRIGGTLWISGASISGAGSRLQREQNIEDSPAAHREDILRIGRNRSNPAILALATDHAGEMIDWLESLGAKYTPNSPRFAPEHTPYRSPRTFNVVGPPEVAMGGGGRGMIRVFERAMEPFIKNGIIDVRVNTRLTGLLHDESGSITGVQVEGPDGPALIPGDAVILTTGGYGANKDLVKKYHPAFDRTLAMCAPSSTGDAFPAVEAIGGSLVNMDLLILEPGHYEDLTQPGFCPAYSSFRGARPPRVSGDIWVNKQGQRFVPEDSTDADLMERVVADQPGAVMYVVFDEIMRKGLTPAIGEWTARELTEQIVSAPTIAALAVAIGIAPDALVETVDAYNRGISEGTDPLGRIARPKPLDEAPFHAVRSDGTIVLTFGGIDVDECLRVKRSDGHSFPNLFAAGEVIGGAQVMGNGFASGMSAGPALTLGRQAARFALSIT